MEYNGIVIIDKQEGIGSTDVVRIIRKKLQQRSVGHSGTLDFLATGVLVVCLGKATKLIEYMQLQGKVYSGGLIFGLETDTYDIEGTKLHEVSSNITESDLSASLEKFVGEIEQIPPMYSALKVNGKRLYNLARQGIEIERKPRRVNIRSLELLNFNYENQTAQIITRVAAGTYIRSLIYDIGKSLNSYATMSSLRRLECSGYKIEESLKIDWETDPEFVISKIIPIADVRLPMDSITVDKEQKNRLLNGMTIIYDMEKITGVYKVFSDNEFIGIGNVTLSGKGTLLKLSKHLI